MTFNFGKELTHVDDIEVRNLPIESIDVLLSGSPDSKVRLHLISLGGVERDIFLNRIAWDKPSISWSRTVYPIRMRRRELEKSILSPVLSGVALAGSEAEKLELLQLQEGETVFLNVRKILTSGIFPTFDTIPRAHATINAIALIDFVFFDVSYEFFRHTSHENDTIIRILSNLGIIMERVKITQTGKL